MVRTLNDSHMLVRLQFVYKVNVDLIKIGGEMCKVKETQEKVCLTLSDFINAYILTSSSTLN